MFSIIHETMHYITTKILIVWFILCVIISGKEKGLWSQVCVCHFHITSLFPPKDINEHTQFFGEKVRQPNDDLRISICIEDVYQRLWQLFNKLWSQQFTQGVNRRQTCRRFFARKPHVNRKHVVMQREPLKVGSSLTNTLITYIYEGLHNSKTTGNSRRLDGHINSQSCVELNTHMHTHTHSQAQ